MSQVEQCPWCGSEISRAKFVEIEARIRSEEQRKRLQHEEQIKRKVEQDFKVRLAEESKKIAASATAQAEKALKVQLAEHAKALQAAKETEKALKSQLDAQKKANEAEVEKAVTAQVNEQRAILAQQKEKELAKKDNEQKRERDKMQARLKELTKQLEKRTANELGEGPEIDLLDALRERFSDDKIVRVKKGQQGADIHQTVMHRGETCGLIILDSKNHQAWRNDFASKLREDQVQANADHAILSTTVFPSGQKELCIVDGVIAVSPERVCFIVEILRGAMISLHKQGMSLQKRRGKMEELYGMLTSTEFADKFAEANRATQAILELDVEEKKQHDKTWRHRGRLAVGLQKLVRGIDDDIYAIIGGAGASEISDDETAHEEEEEEEVAF